MKSLLRPLGVGKPVISSDQSTTIDRVEVREGHSQGAAGQTDYNQ